MIEQQATEDSSPPDKESFLALFTPRTIASIAFVAFLVGLSVVIGQISTLGITYLSTFTYADVVIYSVYGSSLLVLYGACISLLGLFFIFPFDQIRGMFDNWGQYTNNWLRIRATVTLLFPILLISFVVLSVSEGHGTRIIAIIFSTLWVTLAYISYLQTRKEEASVEFFSGFSSFFERAFYLPFSAPGLFVMLTLLFTWSSHHTESRIENGRHILLEMKNPNTEILVKIISANSNYVVVSQNNELTLLNRTRINAIQYCVDENSSACLISKPSPLRTLYFPELNAWNKNPNLD